MDSLPLDVKLEIFDHLSLNDIGQISSASKDQHYILSQERSQQLIAKKIKEEQQKEVEEIEPILSRIISYGIKNLTSFVRFDYPAGEIVFFDMESDADYPLEDFFEEDEMTPGQIVHKYLDLIVQGNVDVHTWVNRPFLRHLTRLVITNDHGVNDDSRSHRGDTLYQDQGQATIKRKAYCGADATDATDGADGADATDGANDANDANDDDDDDANDDDDDDDDFEDSNDIRMFDYKYHNPKWETENKGGITWGDILEGVMNVKGSKSDFWYELIGGATAKIVDETLFIELETDFGS